MRRWTRGWDLDDSPTSTSPPPVSDLTEARAHRPHQRTASAAPAWLLVGIGDDAAVVEPERNRLEVLSVDALVEGVHFDRAFTPPAAIGHRALAVNLSDLAAMGAAPRLALLSLALPASLPLADFDGIIDGLAALAARSRMHHRRRQPDAIAGPAGDRHHGHRHGQAAAGADARRRAAWRRSVRQRDDRSGSGWAGDAASMDKRSTAGTLGRRGQSAPVFESDVDASSALGVSASSAISTPSRGFDSARCSGAIVRRQRAWI